MAPQPQIFLTGEDVARDLVRVCFVSMLLLSGPTSLKKVGGSEVLR